jgi:capsid protein
MTALASAHSHPLPRADYHATGRTTRRRAPASTTYSEDIVLGQSKRRKLIGTVRDLTRNFEIAAWAIRMHLDYVASFDVQFRTPDETLNDRLEELVRWWSRADRCDAAARHGLHRMVRIGEACAISDGDFFYGLLRDGRVQGIEGDRVRTPDTNLSIEDRKRLTHGCELDAAGALRRIAVCRRERNQLIFDRWFRAENVIHRGYFSRIDQVRGVTPFASAINRMVDLYEGFDYAHAKAKLSNLFGLKVTRQKLDGFADWNTVDASDGDTPDADTDRYKVSLQDGPFKVELDRGDDLEFLESRIPATEFRQFCEQMIRVALLSADIPYEFYDATGMSYSAGRQKVLQYYQSARAKREDVREVVDRLLRWRIGAWIASGLVEVPRGLPVRDIRWEVISTGVPWLDPLKEVVANQKAVEAGFTSELRVCREHGLDLREVLAEQEYARRLRRQYGLDAPSAATAGESDDEREASREG